MNVRNGRESSMRRSLILLTSVFLLHAMAVPAATPQFLDVADTSFMDAHGDRTLQLSTVVAASPRDAFAALTTGAGWKTWAVPFATGEFRVGGVFETSYRMDATAGDRGNIKTQVIASLPDRLLILRNLQAPPDFKDAELFGRTVMIVELVPVTATSTRVVFSGVGFGPSPAFDDLYGKFHWGNSYSLANLKRRFETGPIDWAKELAPRTAPK